MKKIGILGGTFNPPHIGHLIVANEVLDALQLDEIRFMPNYAPPHKQKTEEVSDQDRIMMLQYAIEGQTSFSMETIEMEREGPSYTFDTIQLLRQREPDHEFYFIIGADMIEYLPNWHQIDELVQLVTFVGVKRPGYLDQTTYPVLMIDTPQIFLSSTLIRDRIKQGKTIDYLVSPRVKNYMKEKGLYEA